MGLDMYLNGERRLKRLAKHRQLVEERYRLGYWRKHPNLHGYIIQEFADGVDDCQEILLTESDLRQIREAIENNALPHTEGFFFGCSDGSEAPDDHCIITAAPEWLLTPDEDAWRTIIYRASW